MTKVPLTDYQKIEDLFAQIAKTITSSVETKKIIQSTMVLVEAYFHPANWSIFEYHPETHDLSFAFAKGLDREAVKSIRLALGEGIVGHVAKTRKSLLENDVDNNPLFNRKVDKLLGFKTNSIVAVPVVFQEMLLGVIELINTLDNHPFSAHDMQILETIADFAAIALTNAKMYEKAEFLALHDPLTKLSNRTHLENLLNNLHEISAMPNQGQYALAAWMDLDGFKEVNDNLGHSSGDRVLCKFAQFLKEINAGDDYIFRVGGDEFLLVRLNLTPEQVAQEKIKLMAQLEANQTAVEPATGFSYGVSIGETLQLRKIISESDELMYVNKREHHQETSV